MSDLYWCEYNAATAANAECRFLKRPHDRLEPSRDAEGRLLALLVVDECERCDGEGAVAGDTEAQYIKPCPSCGGRGWQARGELKGDDTPARLVVVPLPEGE